MWNPAAGVTGVVSRLLWVLRTKVRSSAGIASALNPCHSSSKAGWLLRLRFLLGTPC